MGVVAAVGTASKVAGRHGSLAKRIENAMADAVRDALAEGIPMSDAALIRYRMMQAREAVVQESRRSDRPDGG